MGRTKAGPWNEWTLCYYRVKETESQGAHHAVADKQIRQRDDAYFMQAALKEAHKAELAGEVPIGAVIVREGTIIARGHNKRETLQDATLHAELVAIRQACRHQNRAARVG